MNQFTEVYKLKTNAELIRIIQNSTEYQELALEAAKEELSKRGVTEADINETEIIENSKGEDDYLAIPIFKRISSYLESNTTEDNIILGISILSGLWSIISLFWSWKLLQYAIFNYDFITFLLSIIMLIPAISTVLFWERKKIGWILLAILLTCSIIETTIKFLNAYLYDKPDISINIGIALGLGLLLYTICKPKIREIYNVDNKVMTHVIGWTFSVVIILYIYFTY